VVPVARRRPGSKLQSRSVRLAGYASTAVMRFRLDKRAEEADAIDDLRALLPLHRT
jgi:hypothetical protein